MDGLALIENLQAITRWSGGPRGKAFSKARHELEGFVHLENKVEQRHGSSICLLPRLEVGGLTGEIAC
jgi:hypothetical protein